jgi:hypothetical protein
MELEYTPTEDDLIALARHRVAISPVVQQRLRTRHLIYVIGLSVLAIVAYFALPDKLAAIAFAALASLALLIYPYFARWRLNRATDSLARRQATPASYAPCTLRALPDGLEQIRGELRSKFAWRSIDAVFEKSRHTFLSLDGTYTIVVPRDRVPEEDYTNFIDGVREYRVTAGRSI